jgi:hypothetical protein
VASSPTPAALPPNPAQPALVAPGEDAQDAAQLAAFFAPPQRPADYQLPIHLATQQGLQVDFAAESELKTALHAAGVDNNLASSLYTVAIGAMRHDITPLSVASEYASAEPALRREWGSAFEANLRLANAEGKRLFDALPDSARDGMTYAEYALVMGFANSAPVAMMLLARAQSRTRTSKGGR